MIDAVVDAVLKKTENAAGKELRAADDYMDTGTGLLVCGKCHTRKQKRISFLGEEHIVCCLCRCAAEEQERERIWHEEEEKLICIGQMRSAGLQDKTFYGS